MEHKLEAIPADIDGDGTLDEREKKNNPDLNDFVDGIKHSPSLEHINSEAHTNNSANYPPFIKKQNPDIQYP